MERKEAIEVLRRLPIGLMDLSCEQKSDLTEALNIALAALRGPAQEQEEKAFGTIPTKSRSDLGAYEWLCPNCNAEICADGGLMNFCPVCGTPITHKGMRREWRHER